MKIKAGNNFLGLYLYLYLKTENRIYWFNFGFYINDEMYTLVEISAARKRKENN